MTKKLDLTLKVLGSMARELDQIAGGGKLDEFELGRLVEFALVLRGAYETHRSRCGSPAALVFEAGHSYHGLTCDRPVHALTEQHVDRSGLRSWNDVTVIEAWRAER